MEKWMTLQKFPHTFNRNASAVLIACLSADHKCEKYSRTTNGRTRTFIIYSQLASHMLVKYVNDEVIAETESNITNFTHTSNITELKYAEALVMKLLRCGEVYENVL